MISLKQKNCLPFLINNKKEERNVLEKRSKELSEGTERREGNKGEEGNRRRWEEGEGGWDDGG